MTVAQDLRPETVGRVCIAVPTFRRPERLSELLRTLALQDIDSSKYTAHFVVIDNDITPAVASIVDDAKLLFKYPLGYLHVPDPGLAAVRNAALTCATAANDDLLAMIDDDEVPEPTWLSELLRVRALTKADAVVGPVLTCFPDGTPTWVRVGRFFEFPRFEDCAEIDFGFTGNCLLNLSAIASMRLEFDTDFGFSGGEDMLFFLQLLARGGTIVYAAEAVATEYIPLARTSLRYIITRAFRGGNIHALCELHMNPNWLASCKLLVKGSFIIILSVCLLPLRILLRGRAGAVKSVCGIWRGVGKLASIAGYRFLGYARTDVCQRLQTNDPLAGRRCGR